MVQFRETNQKTKNGANVKLGYFEAVVWDGIPTSKPIVIEIRGLEGTIKTVIEHVMSLQHYMICRLSTTKKERQTSIQLLVATVIKLIN